MDGISVQTTPDSKVQIVGGLGFAAIASFARPNDTSIYAAADVIGPATTYTGAMTFIPKRATNTKFWLPDSEVMITSASLEIDKTAIISGETSYLLYLYNVAPPSVYADNAAWDLAAGDRPSFLGAVNLGTPVDIGSTVFVETNSINKQITLLSGELWGYLVTVGTYTPAAVTVYTITLHALPV